MPIGTAAGVRLLAAPGVTPQADAHDRSDFYEVAMLRLVLLIIVVMLLIGALPTWPYSAGWGYYPTGGLSLLLVLVIILAVVGWV
jgi:hypothetical protein